MQLEKSWLITKSSGFPGWYLVGLAGRFCTKSIRTGCPPAPPPSVGHKTRPYGWGVDDYCKRGGTGCFC